MCMRKCFLNFGEKIFNVLVVIGFIAGAASGIMSGMELGGREGLLSALVQIVISWSGTLIISLIVYSLLDIRHTVTGNCDKNQENKTAG